jgi:hypothetical protein
MKCCDYIIFLSSPIFVSKARALLSGALRVLRAMHQKTFKAKVNSNLGKLVSLLLPLIFIGFHKHTSLLRYRTFFQKFGKFSPIIWSH